MCTVSFVPNDHGFYLAMNRDEKRSRETALPPAIFHLGECRAIYPRETNGGTWIAANDAGVCVALINWHRINRIPAGDIVSRGEVARVLAGKSCSADVADAIAELTLRELKPFRLIAIVPSEQTVTEWRWNLVWLAARAHPWEAQHWFSSGFDERKAEFARQQVCAQARRLPAGLAWLRRLHSSHAPEPGPFSICMHRSNAATVSYTEVAVTPTRLVMRYKDGAPCSARTTTTKTLRLS